MSMVRMGLSENKKFGDNYDSIFKKKTAKAKPAKKAAKKKSKRG